MISVLADLALPSRCVGCADARGPLCARCESALGRPRRHRPDPAPVGLPPLAVSAAYAGPARACLLAYKERGRRDLAAVLAAALAAAVEELLGGAPGPLWLVPVPSAAGVARRRGGQHVQRLAVGAARLLATAGIVARAAPVLDLAGGRPDTAALSAAERGLASVGKFVADPERSAELAGTARQLLIVDDLVTTGSTIADAARALRACGLVVAGGAAVAGTLRRNPGYPSNRQGLLCVPTAPAATSSSQQLRGQGGASEERGPGSPPRQPGGVPTRPGSATVKEDLGREGVTLLPALVPVVCRPRRAELAALRNCARRALITAQEVAWTSS